MITQDLYPYDLFRLGITRKYMPYGNGDFYINLPNILTRNNILSLGKLYVLWTASSKVVTSFVAEVVDVFVDGSVLTIILSEVKTNKVITIEKFFKDNKWPWWWLVDETHIMKMMKMIDEVLEIIDYCND